MARSPFRQPPKRGDTKDFSGKGKYTPTPGRGPYNWKDSGATPASQDGGDWVLAPGTSHLAAFRLLHGLDSTERSVLQVHFRDGKQAEYYSVPGDGRHTAERLETIFLLMESADHPGQIIWSHLIVEHWPYQTL